VTPAAVSETDRFAAARTRPAKRGFWFRIGDRPLHLLSSETGFLDEFDARFRGCRIDAPASSADHASIHCEAEHLSDSSLLSLDFEGAGLPDLIRAAATPFRMLRHLDRYREAPGPRAGWRMLVDREDRARPLVSSDGRRLLLDVASAPLDFATDCVASVVQAAQPEVMFLHAASFSVGGAGALLIAAGRGGKSTTALALAARGHRVLGDDMAAVRLRSCELLPFRKVASLRPGRYVRSLEARLRATPHSITLAPDGEARTLVHLTDLFPASAGPEVPLRFAFLLDGFAERPRLSAYRPTIGDARRLRAAVSESLPFWGISPGRDLMKFLTVVSLLSRLECNVLELGSPEDSAVAIESSMEGAWH
jgi:hypothetical protein